MDLIFTFDIDLIASVSILFAESHETNWLVASISAVVVVLLIIYFHEDAKKNPKKYEQQKKIKPLKPEPIRAPIVIPDNVN
jgi:uncharacterized membrane protein